MSSTATTTILTVCDDPEHAGFDDCRLSMSAKYDPETDLDTVSCLFKRMKICIVRLRRHIRVEETWERFQQEISTNLSVILQEFNSRWFISIMDTYADYGTPVERANAALLSMMVNWERYIAATRPEAFSGNRLWEGLSIMCTAHGADGHRNLFRRINGAMSETPTLQLFFQKLLDRCLRQPEFTLSRLDTISDRDIDNEIRRVVGIPTVTGRDKSVRVQRTVGAIPKVAHFIWISSPLPPEVNMCIEGFKKLHPGWEVKLWCGFPRNTPPWMQRAAAKAPQICSKADLLRYWILFSEGGCYFDVDFEFKQPIDDLCKGVSAWVGHIQDGRVNCAAIGSAKRSSEFDMILHECKRASTGIQRRVMYGPGLLTRLVRAGKFTGKVYPMEYFYDKPNSVYANHGVNRIARASHRRRLGRGDEILVRVPCGVPVSVVEIGVLRGKLSSYLLGMHDKMTLSMVDRWSAADPEETYAIYGPGYAQMNTVQITKCKDRAVGSVQSYGDRAKVFHMLSEEAVDRQDDASFDLVFIDADHLYLAVQNDIKLWWPKVKSGGWIGGHDYDHPQWPDWGVKRAADEFAEREGLALETGDDLTWFVRKP